MASWHRSGTVDFSQTDYPGTTYFVKAAKFLVPPTPRTIKCVIIHITGGPAMTEQAAINQFLAGPSSAHYIVNREGAVVQMVPDGHIANHVGNIHSLINSESIGIEHVNPYHGTTRMTPTERQYQASARLVRWLCQRYGIPISHQPTPGGRGIKGHHEADPHGGHTACPNPAWDWSFYIKLVNNPDQLDRLLSPILLR